MVGRCCVRVSHGDHHRGKERTHGTRRGVCPHFVAATAREAVARLKFVNVERPNRLNRGCPFQAAHPPLVTESIFPTARTNRGT